jgi:hypothetical protein
MTLHINSIDIFPCGFMGMKPYLLSFFPTQENLAKDKSEVGQHVAPLPAKQFNW